MMKTKLFLVILFYIFGYINAQSKTEISETFELEGKIFQLIETIKNPDKSTTQVWQIKNEEYKDSKKTLKTPVEYTEKIVISFYPNLHPKDILEQKVEEIKKNKKTENVVAETTDVEGLYKIIYQNTLNGKLGRNKIYYRFIENENTKATYEIEHLNSTLKDELSFYKFVQIL